MNRDSYPTSRREFLKGALAGAACLGLGGLPLSAFGESRKLPNFVIIYCDDLGYGDIGCFGSPQIKTPNIDRMASEGMLFTDFYSAAPVCTPSRAALMTGCYPQRVNLPQVINYRSKVGISDKEITLAQVLKTRGYATACIGKWHLGWQKPFLPTRHGFDYYYGIPYSNDMDYIEFHTPLMRNEKIIEQPVVQETLTERYTGEVIKFITEHKDEPFFVYLPHTFPHVPLHASERFRNKSAYGLYGDVVQCIDWSTGQILDTLKKLGLDDNTIVMFSSDNGPWMAKDRNAGSAGPLRGGKFQTWDGGMREPTIMRWPGHIPAGGRCSEVATTMDVFPTFAKLAGARVPTDRIIDGKDIRPLMMGKPDAISPHEEFFFYSVNRLEAVRSGKWKLVLPHKDQTTNEDVPLSLFDLSTDVGETTDLSAKYPSIVKRLQAAADKCREDLGDKITGVTGKNVRPCGRVGK